MIFPVIIYSQNFQQRFGSIPFSINGIASVNPFNGGLDIPRFQMIDIDNDNDLDLFIYDRDTSLNFYKNEGSNTNAVFRLNSYRFLNLPVTNWFYFADIDSDNDYDLFTGGNFQSVKYFKNTGTPLNPVYELYINELKTNTDSTIISESISTPAFGDINADGDLDFFTGSSVGRITYYENIGTPQNFNFKFITGFFQNIEIIGGGDNAKNILLKDDPRHGASSIYFSDNDGDNDLDLYWGDFFGSSIYFLKNNGTPQDPNIVLSDSSYPHPAPWHSLGYNMPRLYDIDNDGKKDLFASVLYGSQTKNNFVYYKNNGPVNAPQFSKITENYITSIDAASNSFPAFTDIDNDGDYDLYIGSDHATILFYRNTGSQNNPSFELVTDSLPIIFTSFNYAPCFGDLNNDGKKDMLLGAYDGKIRYLLNTGTIQNPVFSIQQIQFDTVDVGQSSTPQLVDIDNDGDFDLFVGNWNGRISYYVNTGSSSNFEFNPVSSFYLNIDVGDESNLWFTDIDSDKDYDMFIGRRDGKISYYKNDGNLSSPNFNLITDNYANINIGSNSVPSLIDINADTDKDLYVGNIKGGIFYFENMDIIGIKNISNEIPQNFKLFQNYPNPFNPSTKIRYEIPYASNVFLTIFDLLGRQVAVIVEQKQNPGVYEAEWNAAGFASGVYYYILKVRQAGSSIVDFRDSKKLILIK